MDVKQQHPSVRFQNGEVTDFYTAMQVLVEQQQFERQQLIEIGREYGGVTWQERERASKAVAEVEAATEMAKVIYREVVEEACKRAAERMREHNDYVLNSIADALENGNYSTLAI